MAHSSTHEALRVGVLMGGKSIEREVSFESGRTVCDHLDTSRYEIVPLFQTAEGVIYILPWRFLHRGKISDFVDRLPTEAQKVTWDEFRTLIDFMYIAVHGRFAEDGTLQGMLEILNIPYLGSGIFSSALSMDKVQQKSFLRMHTIDVARDITLTPADVAQCNATQIAQMLTQNKIALPCIVKPAMEGSSLGIRIVQHEKDLHDAAMHACHIHAGIPQSVLIEEKIEGMEFSCITILENDYKTWLPLPPTEVVIDAAIGFFDYEQKYMPGRTVKFTPARCDDKTVKAIQDTCIKTAEALEMKTISRIDGFVAKDNRIIITDPNTLSGMAPSSFLFREAAEIGMGHPALINHLIASELHTTENSS